MSEKTTVHKTIDIDNIYAQNHISVTQANFQAYTM